MIVTQDVASAMIWLAWRASVPQANVLLVGRRRSSSNAAPRE